MEHNLIYTNILFGSSDAAKKYVRKRLSDGSSKPFKYAPSFRKAIELVFDSDCEKLQFELQCEYLKEHLGVSSLKELTKNLVMDFDKLTKNSRSQTLQTEQQPTVTIPEMADIDESCETVDNKECFVAQCSTVVNFLNSVQGHKNCRQSLVIKKMRQTGHVLTVEMVCPNKHVVSWSSSTTIDNEERQFFVNHRIFHAYLNSGMTQFNTNDSRIFRYLENYQKDFADLT